jgi:hypothetical protein
VISTVGIHKPLSVADPREVRLQIRRFSACSAIEKLIPRNDASQVEIALCLP